MLNKAFSLIYVFLLIVLTIVFSLRISNITIDSSILSLLPTETQSKVSKTTIDTYTKRLDRQVVFLIKDNGDGVKACDFFNKELKKNKSVENVIGAVDKRAQQNFNQFLYNYKTALISEKAKARMENSSYEKWVLSTLYSGFSGVTEKEIISDPLLLTRDVATFLSKDVKLNVKNGYLSVTDEHNNLWYFLNVRTKSAGFDINSSKEFCSYVDNLIAKTESLYKGTTILKRGTVFYSDYASALAQKDLTVLGSITIIGVFALIFFVFRTVIPVALTVLSVSTGILAGFSFLCIFFDTINLVIIGMSLSVVGVVCDYTIYYMTLRVSKDCSGSPIDTIKQMIKPLLFAVGTDVVAYLIIVLSPVTPLKQLSVFCMAAITFSCLTVILIEPYLCAHVKKKDFPLKSVFNGYLKLVASKKVNLAIIVLIVLTTAFGLSKFSVNDDPASFQNLPAVLKIQDDEIAKITNQKASAKYLIIEANSEDKLLHINESLQQLLELMVKNKDISSYRAIPLVSLKTQEHNFSLIQKTLKSLKDPVLTENKENLVKLYSYQQLSLDKFIQSPLGNAYEPLYIKGSDNSPYALSILLYDVKDRTKLESEISRLTANAYYLDRKDDFAKVFSHYRVLISYVLYTFLIVIFLVSVLRLGVLKGLVAAVFSLISVLFALATILLSGYQLNLFSELALILVLGIGVNYTIFFNSNTNIKSTSLVAIVTALLTTLLTMGVLVLSSVSAISGFALALSSGILCSFVLSTILPELLKDVENNNFGSV
ncbi:MAG: hypothetical protein J6O24_08600 [Succinivibrio sp.]|nr:hypothetical protein [Succinivibrio sp.]